MSRIDLSEISSNWRRLQETLQIEKKTKKQISQTQTQTNSVKRRRADDRRSATDGVRKRPRVSQSAPSKRSISRPKMGSSTATQYPSSSSSSSTSGHPTLTQTHDIPAQDLAQAYGGGAASSAASEVFYNHTDVPNAGLSTTHKSGKYLALDCEMVGTGEPPHFADNVLARVSLVNFHGQQVYDSYVLPPNPRIEIRDFRTPHSGIHPHHLRPGYARPFAEVQTAVAQLLSGRILVGHALRNDLLVLVLAHPRRDMRDTSSHARFRVESRGKPPALRNLALSELGVSIQTGEHSSVEDARAAMCLFRKEKREFEEESRRRFGAGRRDRGTMGLRGVRTGSAGAGEDQGDADDDPGEVGTLDGEQDDSENGTANGITSVTRQDNKKRKKKKKRTKRK